MRVYESGLASADALPVNAAESLRRWAVSRPLSIALCHKRRGRWKAWRWAEVPPEVARLETLLRRQGFGSDSRLALCGALEPTLILFALAALAAGGQVVSAARQLAGEELRVWLLRYRPSHAFLQSREAVSRWLEVGAEQPHELLLFSARSAPRQQGNCRVLPLAGPPAVALPQPWQAFEEQDSLWSEEGSEWREGLSLLLERWLDRGEGLAFPENSESAARDRREVSPVTLLLSSARQQALAEEIEHRLAPADSWRRRLCDWAARDTQRGIRRWIEGRVRELLGLRRLRTILPGPASVVALPHAYGWLREDREQAA
ncbi:hypothetical protein [Azomonas macrocytogenes]|uniref:AMP-dependent synthetase/ligase domain-containing protein n=1 Tax=Azomonas macrocytogenes TaxID=69962 RepID=A0A839T848_AZOMA|nr:hypothetical protein [Azomonas macrocytogenes]MBB3105030.1 hypothetical protein [Azomonas macrocytogenes]